MDGYQSNLSLKIACNTSILSPFYLIKNGSTGTEVQLNAGTSTDTGLGLKMPMPTYGQHMSPDAKGYKMIQVQQIKSALTVVFHDTVQYTARNASVPWQVFGFN